ncbi:type IV pilus modification PilV family protein [Leucobacter sp. HY1910]
MSAADHPKSDAGMSLVELIMVVLISALVLTVLASLFGNGLAAQQGATERTLATSQANAAAAQVNKAIRESVSARIFPTFTNTQGLPQTQLNLTKETDDGLICEVWIWEDRADGDTIFYHNAYRNYADDPIPGNSRVSRWKTDAGTGRHVVSSTGSGGVQPRGAHFTFDIGGEEGKTSVVVTGGANIQGRINTAGVTNPCAGSW